LPAPESLEKGADYSSSGKPNGTKQALSLRDYMTAGDGPLLHGDTIGYTVGGLSPAHEAWIAQIDHA